MFKFIQIYYFDIPFFTNDDVNHCVFGLVGVVYLGLGRFISPQNVLMLAGENSVQFPIFGSDLALTYPAVSPLIGQSHTNHLEIPGMVLIFLSFVLLYLKDNDKIKLILYTIKRY